MLCMQLELYPSRLEKNPATGVNQEISKVKRKRARVVYDFIQKGFTCRNLRLLSRGTHEFER